MIKIDRYRSFNELKSASSFSLETDTKAFEEYEMFIKLLQQKLIKKAVPPQTQVNKIKSNG